MEHALKEKKKKTGNNLTPFLKAQTLKNFFKSPV